MDVENTKNNEIQHYRITNNDKLLYTSHYCEENVYQLSRRWIDTGFSSHDCAAFAVFISNSSRKVPIWKQKLSEGADSPVVWDYHVIFITFEKGSSEGWVIDQDSRLGFPARLSEYISASFKPGLDLGSEFIQNFRVIPADQFISHFASDRSHMIDTEATARGRELDITADTVYYKPVPTWAVIKGDAADTDMNLEEYISMESKPACFGNVYDLKEFIEWGTAFMCNY